MKRIGHLREALDTARGRRFDSVTFHVDILTGLSVEIAQLEAELAAAKTAINYWRRPVPQVSATTQRLIDLLIERDQAGLAKYGTSLDRTDLSHVEWLQHMTEEALDAAGYAQAAIRTYQEQGK